MRERLTGAALLCLALLPSAWLAWSWRSMPQTGVFHDDALYLVSAKSLAEGNGYRIASLPGEPYQTKYPPLYPALLALVWRADPEFPGNLPKVMLVTWACLAGAVWLARSLMRQCGFSNAESLGLAAFLALSPVAVQYSVMAMSELPFCAVLFASLMLAERGKAFWAGAVGGLAFLTRGAALPLLVTAPLIFLWCRQPGKAVRFAAGMAPLVAAWQIWAALHRAPADPLTLFYTDYFGFHRRDVPLADWPRLLIYNLNPAVNAIGGLLVFDPDPGFASQTLARLLTMASVSGCVRLVRQGRLWHYAAFAAVYILQFLFWNYPPNTRFFLPLLPLAAAGLWRELQSMRLMIAAAMKRKTADRVAAYGMCGIVALLGIVWVRAEVDGLFEFLPPVFRQRAEFAAEKREAQRWVEAHAGPTATLLSYQDPIEYLYTGRRACSLRVPPGMVRRADPAEIRGFFAGLPKMMADHGITHAVLGEGDYQMDAPDLTLAAYQAVFKDSSRFEPVFEQGATKVYRLRREWAYDRPR